MVNKIENIPMKDRAEDIYKYRLLVDDPRSDHNGKAIVRSLAVGIGVQFDERARLRNLDGCSGPLLQGDKENWRTPCELHDIMYSLLPPMNVSDADWQLLADEMLKVNMTSICQKMWPSASPGLGGCFDGARSSFNFLRNGFGKPSYDKNQAWARGKDGMEPPLTRVEYQVVRNYLDRHPVPHFGTDWDQGGGVYNAPPGLNRIVMYLDEVGIALRELRFNSRLLSGGSSVRSNTPLMHRDETWQVVNVANPARTGPVCFGDEVALRMPGHHNVLLSGGSTVRTTTTVIGTDERWILRPEFPSLHGQAISMGEAIALELAQHNGLLLSGGSSVRTNVVKMDVDEMWKFPVA